jgi:4-hydroxy-3-polyprenylbenzoate decarboxylase
MHTRILLALTGASGMPYARALLRALAAMDTVEARAIVSDAARKVMALEWPEGPAELERLAARVHGQDEAAAGPASGSWRHAGMVVCPCSMASLAAIATGAGQNLVHRAADVTLKEGRPLVLVARETPLSRVHLRNMLAASEAGAVILPACPAFYQGPQAIEDLADQIAGRVLDQLGLEHDLAPRWQNG